MDNEILFKGWAIKLENLESMIAMTRSAGGQVLRFGVAGMSDREPSEFIDPEGPGEYAHQSFKLFVRGGGFAITSPCLLSTTLDPNSTFDEFPPIPPEPINDPGGG